jgi:Glycosyltransferase sugar-binding region containing DXD motif
VFGLDRQVEPFHLVHYLAVASCLAVVEPDELHIHCHNLPYGFYWDLIRPRVLLHRVEPVQQITGFDYEPDVGRYAYAHHADFVRLDVLARWGGLYADIDTLFLRPPPPELWHAPAVIGREADVRDEHGRVRGALSNALLMSAPGGEFVRVWRERIAGAFDGSWAQHSCLLAHDLAAELQSSVRVEPQRTFHEFEPTREGLRRLLVGPPCSVEGIVSVHLMAHLWWRRARRDFLDLHAHAIDERWIREVDTTYGVAARAFLPEHGEF